MRTVILWFRRDFRLTDNPALLAALADGARLVPVYIHNPAENTGAASRWWLHHNLRQLADSLSARGRRLLIRQGDSHRELARLVEQTGAVALHWNRRYEPEQYCLEQALEPWAAKQGLSATSHKAGLLVEPWEIATGQGTPFHKACQRLPAPQAPTAPPDRLPLDALGLLPTIPWDEGLEDRWQPGEAAALLDLKDSRQAALDIWDAIRRR